MCAVLAGLGACTPDRAIMAPVAAEPNTPPARNFTNFNGALRCMDGLLARAGRGTTLISSTDIPDETFRVAVGADDMLINAINQMNRSNSAYVFVDQAIIKKDGQFEVRIASDQDVTPSHYIRGSISQLDNNVSEGSLTVNVGNASGPITPLGQEKTVYGGNGAHTVVTVDLHLVQYPSRRVVPGGSVANSMVVTSRGFRTGASGLIEMTGVDATLRVTRVESLGQAVRNLVELGAIELLGRHARVPYWTCLSLPVEHPRQADLRERLVTRIPTALQVGKVQDGLIELGYLSAAAARGRMTEETRLAIARFQSDEGLIPSGRIDYDLLERIRRRLSVRVIRPAVKPPAPAAVVEGYTSLNDYLP
ncbi:peptidoglycan-binding protein [Pseudaestuariivita atlantica]|uniref:peptidoglycan-binding protein n=1 Tax=Pseudaestuariivita atlantica TaxID=1317121 RepID=UPI0013F3F740|nr:peptidoglycan-binding protein [Pseudaestuariivita atlantica]